jgi:hypothetical protein
LLSSQKAFKERSLQCVFEWAGPGEGQVGQGSEMHDGHAADSRLEPLAPGQFQEMPLDDIVQRYGAEQGGTCICENRRGVWLWYVAVSA